MPQRSAELPLARPRLSPQAHRFVQPGATAGERYAHSVEFAAALRQRCARAEPEDEAAPGQLVDRRRLRGRQQRVRSRPPFQTSRGCGDSRQDRQGLRAGTGQ
jgi:hypothetical protein